MPSSIGLGMAMGWGFLKPVGAPSRNEENSSNSSGPGSGMSENSTPKSRDKGGAEENFSPSPASAPRWGNLSILESVSLP